MRSHSFDLIYVWTWGDLPEGVTSLVNSFTAAVNLQMTGFAKNLNYITIRDPRLPYNGMQEFLHGPSFDNAACHDARITDE